MCVMLKWFMKKSIVRSKWYVSFELNSLWRELLSSRESWIFNTRFSTPILVTLSCHRTSSHSDILRGCGCFPMRIHLSSTNNFYHDYLSFETTIIVSNGLISIYEAFWAGGVKQPLNPPESSSIPSSIQTEQIYI